MLTLIKLSFVLKITLNIEISSVAQFLYKSGSRGRVQGVRPPPPPRDDLRLSNTTAILQNMQICMICILSNSHYVIAFSPLLDCEQSLFSRV